METPHKTGTSDTTASFAVLADAARLVLARCPWTSAQTAEGYTAQLRSEADEAVLAVANRDHQNFKEELGDLVWDVVMCALLAERSGHFPAHEVFDDVVAKMRRRKPFVFDGTEVTEEEAQRIWMAAKAQEKQGQ
jgi:NTP pyrophosphatase (non-canonical NTP hydrolase)